MPPSVVREAARRGIPTAVHESNAEPGLTTKMLSKYVDKVMVGFEESRKHYPHPDRVAVTGTPVREEFFLQNKAEARKSWASPMTSLWWSPAGAPWAPW